MSPEHPASRLVLIVERDHVVRDLQAFFLGRAGFAVDFVEDGEAALERARLTAPSVVITEILVPKVDGLALCRQLREDAATRNIPVIVFSILAAGARAAEAGASAFLRKPLVESLFLTTVESVIAPQSFATMEQQ
jgi:CheY-like chemotaxis protein